MHVKRVRKYKLCTSLVERLIHRPRHSSNAYIVYTIKDLTTMALRYDCIVRVIMVAIRRSYIV